MARRIIHRESFNPPSLLNPDAASASASTSVSRWPESVILANRAYIADCRNATTATAQSRDDYTVQIAFCFTEAPMISYFCAHCYNPKSSSSKVEFYTEPAIVGAEGALVVLRVHFSSPLLAEFFIYRAGPGSPSLERVQDPTDHRSPIFNLCLLGIVSCGDDDEGGGGDGGNCLLVGFRNRLTHYDVYVYTSTTKNWSTRRLDRPPGVSYIRPQKVINLGRGLLGWVDLWHGILIFNAHDEQPKIQYIPLPEPMPLNKESFHPSNRSESCPVLFRDVICSSDGEIKFVELEQRQRIIQPIPQEPEDVCDRDVLDDSYLMSCTHMDNLPKEETPYFVGDGWRAVTWSRIISSNCWHKGYMVDIDDIPSADEVFTSTQRGKGLEMLRFRDLLVFPTLSLNGAGDLLYLKSTVKFQDFDGWVSSIDIGKKAIKVLKPYSSGRQLPFVQMFRSCVLCHHLTVPPGPENMVRFIETSCNENQPKTTAASIMPEPTNHSAGNKRSRSPTRLSPVRVQPATSWSPAFRGWPSARVAKPALNWRSCPPSLSPVPSTSGANCNENQPKGITASMMPEPTNHLAGNKWSRSPTRLSPVRVQPATSWSPALWSWHPMRVGNQDLSWWPPQPSLVPSTSGEGLGNTAGYQMTQTGCSENYPCATGNTTPRLFPEDQFTQHGYEQQENDFISSAPNFVRWHRPPFSASGRLPPPPPMQQPSAFGILPPPARPLWQFSACGTMLPPSSSQPFCSSVRSLAVQTFATPGPILPGPPVTPLQWPVWPQAGPLQQELPPHIPSRVHQ